MAEIESPYCPECDEAFDFPEPQPVDRRDFIRGVVGGTAAAVALTAGVGRADEADKAKVRQPRPAEDLVRELFAGLDDAQKKRVVLDFDHGADKGGRPTRLGMYNQAINNIKLKDVYTKPQQELIERIVKSMCAGEQGY